MVKQKSVITLLVLIAILLAANLVVKVADSVPEAQAAIVEGKNIFSTNSQDGKTVFLWGYTQTGSFNNTTVDAFYFGKITPDGFVKP